MKVILVELGRALDHFKVPEREKERCWPRSSTKEGCDRRLRDPGARL